MDGPTALEEHAERLYIDDGQTAFALEQSTGATIWQTNTELAVHSRTVISDDVYVVSGRANGADDVGEVLALSQRDGRHLWRNQVPVDATASSAAGLVIVSDGIGGIYGLDPTSGKRVWHTPPPPPGFVSFGGYHRLVAGGGTIYSIVETNTPAGTNDVLRALDPLTGRVRWTVDPNGAIAEKQIAEGSSVAWLSADVEGIVHLLRQPWTVEWQLSEPPPRDNLAAIDIHTGEIAWKFNAQGINPPLLRNGLIYLASLAKKGGPHEVTALDARNGRSVWTTQLELDWLRLIAGPGYADGYLTYTELGADANTLCLVGGHGILTFDRRTGAKAWSAHVDDSNGAPPIIESGIVCVGRDKPSRVGRWRTDTGQELSAIQVVGSLAPDLIPARRVLCAISNLALHAIPWRALASSAQVTE